MNIFVYVLAFVVGSVVGSGVNAYNWRRRKDVSWLAGRSQCPRCGRTLGWWELIPLVSFVMLGGTCNNCGQEISWRYPLVELTVGLIYVLAVQLFGLTMTTLLSAVGTTLLVIIFVYDTQTMVIPDGPVWLFNGLGFFSLFVHTSGTEFLTWPGWAPLVAGPAVAAPLVLIWLASRGRAMGLADGTLSLGIGWWLGITGGFSAVIFAFWIGAAVSLSLLGWQYVWKNISHYVRLASTMEVGVSSDGVKTGSSLDQHQSEEGSQRNNRLHMKSAVPFGPFLVLGFILAHFGGFGLF